MISFLAWKQHSHHAKTDSKKDMTHLFWIKSTEYPPATGYTTMPVRIYINFDVQIINK